MVTKKELLAFQKSDEYKTMIDKCFNRKVDLEAKLLEAYKNDEDCKELSKNMHHHYLEISKVFRRVVEELNDESKGALAFKSELISDIEKYEEGIVGQITNGAGIPYTSLVITDTDLERSKVVAYKIILQLLDGMIAAKDVKKAPKMEGAF